MFCHYTAVTTRGVNNLTDPDPGIEPLTFRAGGTGGKLISGSVNNSDGSESGYWILMFRAGGTGSKVISGSIYSQSVLSLHTKYTYYL